MPTLLVPSPVGLRPPCRTSLRRCASARAMAPTRVAEMPFSGATPACEALPVISTSQFSWPTAPTIRSAATWPSTLMHITAPPRSAGFELARAVQAALLAHREEQRDRRMRQLVLEERLGEHDEHGAARAVVAAERRRAVRDDAVALAPRLGAGAERHGVEMGREQQPRSRPRSGQVDDQVAGLGRARECACWRRRSGSRRPARRPSSARR